MCVHYCRVSVTTYTHRDRNTHTHKRERARAREGGRARESKGESFSETGIKPQYPGIGTRRGTSFEMVSYLKIPLGSEVSRVCRERERGGEGEMRSQSHFSELISERKFTVCERGEYRAQTGIQRMLSFVSGRIKE